MRTNNVLTTLASLALCQTSIARNLPKQLWPLMTPAAIATMTATSRAHGQQLPGENFQIDHVEVTASGKEYVWLDNPEYPGTENFRVTRKQAENGPWTNMSGHSLDTLFFSAWAEFSRTHVGTMPPQVASVTPFLTATAAATVVKAQATTTTSDKYEDVATSGVIDLPTSTPSPSFVNLPDNDNERACEWKTPGKGHLFFYHPKSQKLYEELRESWLFYIETPWKVSYPGQLRRALEKAGFVMIDALETCESWWSFYPVSNAGVTRGKLEMKIPIGYKPEEWSSYNDMWWTIEDIMEDTFPHGEIAMIVLGSLAVAVLLGLFGRWICLKQGWNVKIRQLYTKCSKKRVTDDDCVELRDPQKTCANCAADMPMETA
jgi:hypothetical protein